MGGVGVRKIWSKWAIASRGSPLPSSSSARASRALVVAHPTPLRTLRRSARLGVLAAGVGVAVERRDPRLHREQPGLVVLVAERARELEALGHAGLRLAHAALSQLGEREQRQDPGQRRHGALGAQPRHDARAVLARVGPVAGQRPHEDRHRQRPQAVEAGARLQRGGEVARRPRPCPRRKRRTAHRPARRRSARADRLTRCPPGWPVASVNRRWSQPPCSPLNSDHSASSVASSGAAPATAPAASRSIAEPSAGEPRRPASVARMRSRCAASPGSSIERARALDERQRGVQASRVERRLGGAAQAPAPRAGRPRRAPRRARRRPPRSPARRAPGLRRRRLELAREASSARSATTARCHAAAHGIARPTAASASWASRRSVRVAAR